MRTCFVLGFAALLSACASGGSTSTGGTSSHVSSAITECTEPSAMDTSGWRTVSNPMFSAMLPTSFARGTRDAGLEVWESGQRGIGFSWDEDPDYLHGTESTVVSTCQTTLAGHPAEVTLFKYNPDQASGGEGAVLILSARWRAVSGDAFAWVVSPSRRDIDRFREVFWTVQFRPGALQ